MVENTALDLVKEGDTHHLNDSSSKSSPHFTPIQQHQQFRSINNEVGQEQLNYQQLKEWLTQMLTDLPGLSAIESLIRERSCSEDPVLARIPIYLLDLGGKRIRPILTLLVAQALRQRSELETVTIQEVDPKLIKIGAGIEMIHMATLLHDDIIDNSDFRRHSPSALKKFGRSATLLAGDFLFVRAFGLCADLGSKVVNATEHACVLLTEGERGEERDLRELSVADSIEIARKKTASLFWLAGFCAAQISGASENVCTEFGLFGEHLGTAFQIIDDVLDVRADQFTLGKRPGSDISERKPSLVNLLWLQSGSQLAEDLLLGDHVFISDTQIVKALKEINSSSIIKQAEEVAQSKIMAARESLKRLRANCSLDTAALELLCDLALARTS